MSARLTDQDRAELAEILRDVIEADRYPFSPKVKRRKELLSKLDPEPDRVAIPFRHQSRVRNRVICWRRSRGDKLARDSGPPFPKFTGKYVKFEDVVFTPKPVQDPIPIWIGGESGPALRRTVKYAHGWYPVGTNPQFP